MPGGGFVSFEAYPVRREGRTIRRSPNPEIAMRLLCLLAASFLVQPVAHAQIQDIVTFESLLLEMTDPAKHARLRKPMFRCEQFSSYDRASVAPGEEGWFANMDRSHFLHTEERDGKTTCVLMDAPGPGAIVRFWGTWHGPDGGPFTNGTLRIYLDGAEEPVIEGPMADVLSGGWLVGPPLSMGVSPATDPGEQGHNLYLPIPYADGCLVTYETDAPMDDGAYEGEALYYQINFRTYDEGTVVHSFTPDVLKRSEMLLAWMQRSLARAETLPIRDVKRRRLSAVLKRDQPEVVELEGPGAIRELSFKLDAKDLAQSLRSVVLQLIFDGKRTVWCPIGDFFGVGPVPRAYETFYTEVSVDGTMTCRWVMPFARDAQVVLLNLGADPVKVVVGDITTQPWEFGEDSLYFHATWRQYAELETQARAGRDLNYVEIQGAGHYVGDVLCVTNGARAWWGEGDEKIYVDGEPFPSHFGTGTEDYYGYAWAKPDFFDAPFHAQPCGDGAQDGGFVSNLRWRGLDVIPFEFSLKVDMELWHWADTRVNFAPTTFFYALAGATTNVDFSAKEAERLVKLTAEEIDPPFRVPGAHEGEAMSIVRRTSGRAEPQGLAALELSEDRHLWWRDAAPGDELELEFEAALDGRRQLTLGLVRADDYGIVSLFLNGKFLKSFDGYAPELGVTALDLGTVDVRPGKNRLLVKITGANPEAEPRHMFGLDYASIEPTRD